MTFTQTATNADAGTIAACSGATVGNVAIAKQATVGGTPSGVNSTSGGSDFDSPLTRALVFFECIVPADTTWGAGNWTVRLNITTGTNSCQWTATYVCRVNSAGVSQETLGSLTGQTTNINTAGTKTHTVNQASQATPDAGDKVYIVLVFTAGTSNRSIFWRSDLDIDAAGFEAGATFVPPPRGLRGGLQVLTGGMQ